MRVAPITVIPVLALLACTSSSPRGSESNGGMEPVAVVLSDPPLVTLGGIDVIEAEQFGSVAGARRLPNGEILVADSRNNELRIFDSAGTFRRKIGQKGQGPGDFGRLTALLPGRGAELLAYDRSPRRLTEFDSAGRPVSFLEFERPPVEQPGVLPSVLPIARYGDGQYLGSGHHSRVNPPTEQFADSIEIWLVDATGHLVSHVTKFNHEWWNYEFSDGNLWFGDRPFWRQGSIAVGDTSWFYSDGRSFEITEYTPVGTPVRTYVSPRSMRPVTAADRARYASTELEGKIDDDRAKQQQILDWLVYPDSMPAYDQLAVDAADVLWARVFPDTSTTATWDLFAPDGTLLGIARVPADLVIHDIGVDYLLAQRKGTLDEPLVVMYRLTRH